LARLKPAFSIAIRQLISGAADRSGLETQLIIYHQTPALLHLQPETLPFIVTHHGPLASEIVRIFGREFAKNAFRGGGSKLEHLLQFQNSGLATLARSKAGLAFEMSSVQREALLRNGIDERRIVISDSPLFHDEPLQELPNIITRRSRDYLKVISAVARIDEFKNLKELVDAVNQLVNTGYRINLEIYGGDVSEDNDRQMLRGLMSEALRKSSHVRPRLPRERLMQMLRTNRGNAVFVCTSCYETFGITPFEAALSGIVTLVPDNPRRVGVASHIATEYRYSPGLEGLLNKLKELISIDNLSNLGAIQSAQMNERIRDNPFEKGFEAVALRSVDNFTRMPLDGSARNEQQYWL
jgi:glycosyltransferase involved in cell wall biosynthesis